MLYLLVYVNAVVVGWACSTSTGRELKLGSFSAKRENKKLFSKDLKVFLLKELPVGSLISCRLMIGQLTTDSYRSQ